MSTNIFPAVVTVDEYRQLVAMRGPLPKKAQKAKETGKKFLWTWKAICERELVSVAMPEAEFKAIPNRGYLFDFAWPCAKVALEIDGGIYDFTNKGKPGGHSSISGMIRDREKDFAAVRIGWVVVRWTTKMINTPNACALRDLIRKRGAI